MYLVVKICYIFVLFILIECRGGVKKKSRVRQDFEFTLHACNCNGKSNKCFFDQRLFDRTGSGGHCIECEDNTEGVNCERCQPLHYRRKDDKECVPCACDSVGSTANQCLEDGQCQCKPGVGTRTCGKCAPNFYDMTANGCRPCGCNLAGIAPDAPSCDPSLGYCPCKENVVGQRCDSCKKGFFDLQLENEFGCVACFCYGHSNECHSAPGFYKKPIESNFERDKEDWTAVDLRGRAIPLFYDADLQIIEVRGQGGEFIYFIAPECYLGNQRASYNQFLSFTLRIGAESVRISAHDVILEGAGLRVSVPITEQDNPIPSHRIQTYRFRLHENPKFGWTPRVSALDYIKILSNLTAIKIKATFSREGIGYLDDVVLESAAKERNTVPATWIEQCACPEGYTGLSCELCAKGYRREPLGDSPYSRCVKCFCHNHADTCDPVTGKCVCHHNTEGNHCERCALSYYGDAREGTSADCKPCLCPDRGPCVVLPGGQVACQQCPLGHTGHQCDMCIDGYHGDPLGRFGPPRQCRKCECSGNIDPNAIGNCNTTTGQCLKCIYDTSGFSCERCLPGYYGDALTLPKGGCKRCICYLPGTIESERSSNPCELTGGQCRCKANVVGRKCDKCRNGFWNIDSGQGCVACDCDRIGSYNQTCDLRSGQCHCHPGVVGRHCDSCAPYHYGFSEEGCKACECDPSGSTSLQCDTAGQCQCRNNREGRRCNICRDNKYSRGTVCLDCPPCYSLLEEAIDRYKDKLTELSKLMDELKNHPDTIEDFDFERKLREAERKIENLLSEAKRAAIADSSLINQLNDLRKRIKEIGETAGKIRERLDDGEEYRRYGLNNISLAENIIQQSKDAVAASRKYLDTQGRDAFHSALDRKDRLGQQSERLSQIAREARQLADQQEEDADVSDNVSNRALNTSIEAYRLARETLDSQEKLSSEVFDLGRRLIELDDFVNRTKDLAEDAKTEANTVYDDALGIYTDANSLVVPTANVETLQNDASRIKMEARRIKAQADSLANEHKNTLSRLDDQAKDGQGLLNEAIRQQQITDELLTDTDAALAKALNAIESGEKILEDAKDTLDTLKGFDQQVKESQERANETIKRIPEVKRKVNEAENKTFDAEDALRGAIQDAADARDIAREAKRLAEQASKDADGIRKEAGQTKEDAKRLKGQAGELTDDVDDTDERMKQFEDEAKMDADSSEEALSRANEAKTAALEALDKGRNAKGKLDDILDALGDLDSVDNSQLDDLERLLAVAERELINADLGPRTDALREAQVEQKKWMRDYEDEIEQLKKDVANVAAIRYSLPEDCYRRLVLEP
ncbi:laminin subunit gamma-1 [Parasteatoda tepidariorum]|uniref:laminin subunit gamma-1 n=1 Tax=Parasteatoda tepidariorum TaxID=114398 RepID=UPI001C728F51|nr:laminin subunit gamma-1 [Parasteatoda tepidariorum]